MYPAQSPDETFVIDFRRNARRAFGVFAKGYFRAAQTLVESCLSRVHFRSYEAYPILFLYRHALELDLKACIYNSALVGWLSAQTHLDHALVNCHVLQTLADKARKITDALFPDDQSLRAFMREVTEAARHIDRHDPQSFAFRYPVDKTGQPAFSEPMHFGLRVTADKMKYLHEGLQAIHFGLNVTEDELTSIRSALLHGEC